MKIRCLDLGEIYRREHEFFALVSVSKQRLNKKKNPSILIIKSRDFGLAES